MPTLKEISENLVIYKSRVVEGKPSELSKLPDLAIGMPFYGSEPYLWRFLHHLLNLDYPKKKLHLYFDLERKDSKVIQIVKFFADTYSEKYASIDVNINKRRVKRKTHLLTGMANLTRARNRIAKASNPYDLVFFDHDIYAPSQTLKRLIKGTLLGAGIVGGIYVMPVRTKRGVETILCLCMYRKKSGERNFGVLEQRGASFIPTFMMGKRIQVEGVGAGCMYITRKVLNDLKFKENIEMAEDLDFCLRAGEKGYLVYADYGLWVTHAGVNVQMKVLPKGQLVGVKVSLDLGVLAGRRMKEQG